MSTDFDERAGDAARSRENYRRMWAHFAALRAHGFRLVLFDLYLDAYEVVKAKKRCAVRIRVVGDEHWYEVTQLDHVGRLDRTVRGFCFVSFACLRVC